jgi:uncharacterized protein YtpQ (UPF0354 family)
MLGLFKKKRLPAEPDQSTILPRIKHKEFLASLDAMHVSAHERPIAEPLVGDLLVSYAFDLPGIFQMVAPADLERLAIRLGELREIAVANLKRQLPEIGINEQLPLRRIVTGNNLEACIMLATTFWSDFSAEMPGDIVAAVPSRDALIFCSSHDAPAIDAMQTLASEIHHAESTHALSEHLFVWQKDQWAVFR